MNLILDCKDREFKRKVDKSKKATTKVAAFLLLEPLVEAREGTKNIEVSEYFYLSKFPPFLQAVTSIKQSFDEVRHV